ncbi:MAG: efflux RND transporter periplasmic adaptor subunit [Dehalococcoidia bacterium]|nr:efflux RND transporter periplasmic adaptor subunit [Dehalococcoidia bacterium]
MAHDFDSGFTGVDKDMGSRKGWYIAGSILAAGVLLAAVALRQPQFTLSPQAPQAEPRAVYTAVRTAAVQRGSIAQVLSYTGDVKAKTQVTVIPKTAGRIQSLTVDVGDQVQAGQRLATLEHDVLDVQVQQAMAGLALANAKLDGMLAGPRSEQIALLQVSVDIATQKLTTLQNGPRPETVAQAEANLKSAQARLAALEAGPTQSQIDAAEAGVRAAKNNLYAVEANADSLLSRMGTGYTPNMKEAQAGAAYEQVQVAEAQLAGLKAPPRREALDQAQAAVDIAAQQLALAQSPFTERDIKQAELGVRAGEQQLRLAQNPYTESDLGAARAAVAQAEASVQLANIQQKNATVESPVSGVVSARFVSTGDMAAPTAPMLTIMGDGMEVQIAVEEAMVSQVSVGKPVSVTVASYPGVTFAGKVASTSPSLDPRTRALAAKVQVDDPGVRLKPGMFAQVSVTASSRDNVLLIPKLAVVIRGQRQIVFVASQGAAVLREIQSGLTDGTSIEVISGLKEADNVILNSLSDLADGDPVQVQGSVQ